MKKLLALAFFGLVFLGLGAHQAHAFGCRCWYKCCAAQYNAFSPFCCNAVICKKPFCRVCTRVLDCCPPHPGCCPPACCGMDFGGCYAGPVIQAPAGTPAPGTGAPTFQPPAPTPVPQGTNTGMMGYPYALPYGMPQGMVHPVGYYPYPNYSYPQSPMMTPGYGAMTTQGIVPLHNVPWYWYGSMPAAGR